MTCDTCQKTRAAIFSMLVGGEDTVEMHADHTYSAARGVNIKYIAGAVYRKVPAVVAASIVAAQAGHILDA